MAEENISGLKGLGARIREDNANAPDIIESAALLREKLSLEASSKTIGLERLEKRSQISENFAKIRSDLAEKQFEIEQNYQKQIDATDDENTKRHLARQKDKELQQIKFDQIRTEASERYLATEQRIGNFIDDVTDPAKFLKRKAKEATIATIAWLLSKKRRNLDHEENLKNIEERKELSTEQSTAGPASTAMVPFFNSTKKSEERLKKMFKGFMPPAYYYENMLLAAGYTKEHQENMEDVTDDLLDTSEDSLKTDKKRNKFQRLMSIGKMLLSPISAITGLLGSIATTLGIASVAGTGGAAAAGMLGMGGAAAATKLLPKTGFMAPKEAGKTGGKIASRLGTKAVLKGAGKMALRAVPVLGGAMMAAEGLSMGAKHLGDAGGWDAARETKNLGAAEINAFGTSEITDWAAVEGLPIAKIQGLIRYDDWDDATMSQFEQIIARKQGKIQDLDPKALPSTAKADQLEQAALTTPGGQETGTPTPQNNVVNAPVTNVTNQTIQDKSFNNDITVQQMNPWAIKEQYA